MKRMLSLILALVMVLSLCACSGEKKQVDMMESQSESIEQTTAPDGERIDFPDPIVLGEDEKFRVELLNFYEEDFDWDQYTLRDLKGRRTEKFVTLKLCNKSEDKFLVHLSELYLGSDGANHFGLEGSAFEIAPGKNIIRRYAVFTGDYASVASLDELYTLDGEFYLMPVRDNVGIGGESYPFRFSVPEAFDSGNEAPETDNTAAWTRFRDYLREQGPVTVVIDKTDASQNQVTLEATEGIIQIRQEGENTTMSGKASVHAQNSISFDLPANAKTVQVQMEYWVGAADGKGNLQIQSSNPTYTWDIENYHSGDEFSFSTDYSHVDGNGNSIKKEGTKLTLVPTKAFVMVTDALSQTLAESGLDVTMADLGFTSY